METYNKYTMYYEKGTETSDQKLLDQLANSYWVPGFTVLTGSGFDGIETDEVNIVEIVSQDDIYTEVYGFCEIIKIVNHTAAVMLTKEIIEMELVT
jgi:hypothetical protein